jgi:hypothetical protein
LSNLGAAVAEDDVVLGKAMPLAISRGSSIRNRQSIGSTAREVTAAGSTVVGVGSGSVTGRAADLDW